MRNVSELIGQIRSDRRALEVDVAKTIADWLVEYKFSSLRQLALQMIDCMLDLREWAWDHGNMYVYEEAEFLKDETSYAMWPICATRAGWKGLADVRTCLQRGFIGKQDFLIVCADVVRLFGEFSEQPQIRGCLNMIDPHWHHMATKSRFRPQPVFAVPSKPENINIGWGHRDRWDVPKKLQIDPRDVPQVNAPFIDIPRVSVPLRGVEKFRFEDHSVIRDIDWTFGLQIEGGDVSGTTSDTIAALQWSGATTGHGNDPFLHLLAIATMVPQGHHTIVETAWPLTRSNKITNMNYRIGFYDTLAPGEGALKNALAHWNADNRNKHVLVCNALRKSGPNETIALHFDQPDEVSVYRDLAEIRSAYSFCVGGPPRLDTLANYVKAKTRARSFAGTQIVDRMFSRFHTAA
ncbi:MAG: hypothetical protein OEM60_14505 [Gammaproteobacteria bacterium]|nr:hypothetical protein [Gammaproteobacteria bacterium]MDH3435074.1 hypothetical protein [Gammaproteobacteria bacterium]